MDDSIPAGTIRDDAASGGEAFQLLLDGTRLEIRQVLWESHDSTNPTPMRFSAIRERVGVDDPGQLNYHLNKLTTHFIRRTEDGYELREAGERIVRVVIAGTAMDDVTTEPAEIDVSCVFCGGRPKSSTGMAYSRIGVLGVPLAASRAIRRDSSVARNSRPSDCRIGLRTRCIVRIERGASTEKPR